MARKVRLKFAIAKHAHTAAILDGSIPIEGIQPEFVMVEPQFDAFRRMVRRTEFDVCELAPATYVIARTYRAQFTALPIFLMRRFHHGGLLVRADAGIHNPKDLEGKQVGVRAYSGTTGVWTRQILIDEFGLDAARVTWVVNDEEHVPQLALPPNVIPAPAGTSLADMMARGELSAAFAAATTIGRTAPQAGSLHDSGPGYADLFRNAEALEAEYHARTGVYPIHGALVVKDAVLAQHPWVARSIYDAFDAAKRAWLARLDAGLADSTSDQKYLKLRKIVGRDPLPYGLQANLKSIEALESTAFKQGLTPRRMSTYELFIDL